MAKVRVGTSGWSYDHWEGLFYPQNLPKPQWLNYYTEHFDTVELNSSFYRLHKRRAFEGWKEKTPPGFLWAVKGSRYITHIKRLTDPEETLSRFYESVEGLGEKIGPILFQLPPSLKFDHTLLNTFLKALKKGYRYTLEIRHPSWISAESMEILKEYQVAFCVSDTAGRFPYHEAITANFIYIRLHGSKKLYASDYTEAELREWVRKIGEWNKDTHVYFDNDFGAYAPKNAQRLKQILEEIN